LSDRLLEKSVRQLSGGGAVTAHKQHEIEKLSSSPNISESLEIYYHPKEGINE
jgi:hypothetical protein